MFSMRIEKLNNVYIRILCDEQSIEFELSDYFKFRAPNFQFHPKFKARLWDGNLRLYNRQTKSIYAGLLQEVLKFARDRNYQVEISKELQNTNTSGDISNFLKSISHFEYRDYQVDAIQKAIQAERLLLLSPTSSGKSLIIYSLLRYFNVNCLLIVPTINLVGQMYTDFEEYSSQRDDFVVDNECHMIYGGQSKESSKRIKISTWQSLHKLPESYFNQFEMIIVDECHTAKSTSIKEILEKTKNCRYRFGTTGTLDGMLTNKMVVQGLLGPVYNVTTTKALMEQGHVSNLTIKCLILKYTEEECKFARKHTYVDEVDFILSHNKRNSLIVNLAVSLQQNTLLLFNFIERHGKLLYEAIENKLKESGSNRKVFFVCGATDADTRNDIRAIVEKENDAIIIASAGVFSAGVNIKNLVNIIFAHSGKSRIRTLQSIGRVLRIGRHDYATLYDIVDDLNHKKRKSYSVKHFIERFKYYQEERFKLKVINLPLEKKKTLGKEQQEQ